MAGHTVVALFSVLVLLVTGVEWFITSRFDSGLADNRISAIVSDDTHLSTATAAPGGGTSTSDGEAVPSFPAENILLLGSDTRAGANADSGNSDSTTEDGVANSDSLMLAHISSDRHITVLSIPRDTMIPAPTCNTWNSQTGELNDRIEPVSEGTRWHINSAFSVGGPQCTVRAVQALTGLRIDRVIGIDFAGFKNMVDALGGISVNICGPIVDAELQTVVAAGGVQTIHGDQALSLVRARKVIGDNDSDLSRIRRQQVVLSAILKQVTAAGTLLNPAKLNAFLQAFTDNTFTDNVTLDNLVTLAQSFGNLDPAKVTFYTLPTVPSTRESGALEVDDSKAPAVFSALLNDQPLPGEQPVATTPADPSTIPAPSTPDTPALPSTITTDPADVAVQVVNATGRTGVATAMMTALNDVGFAVTEDDLRVQDTEQSDLVVEYATGQQDAALTVAASLEGAGLVEVPGLAVPVRLIVGSSWDGAAQPVSVGADTPTWITTAAAPTGTDDLASTGAAPSGDASTLGSTDLPSVNAGQALCA
ncbi:LCP family protein [Nakamurella flavida]|uniref:LCP family protein n=2 Tax=Nakamurella flavida TaxID=363630 RepID=A0A938YRQ5_9ACTN|nr:LCP family protein [Nakamurella flavida]MBM9477685.1 LCP family protein [Nakamurella flavida]